MAVRSRLKGLPVPRMVVRQWDEVSAVCWHRQRPARLTAVESMHFAAAVAAFVTALDGRIDRDITAFPDLFQDDAVIDVPFDGAGDAAPIVGRSAIQDMTSSLDGFLWFDEVTFQAVRPTEDPNVVICEYEAILRRADRDGRLRRPYISVITLRDGRILHLREYGGPFQPVD